MFHKLKEIPKRYLKRFRAVFRYILDYKLLFFSLIYIFSTYFFLIILRNIDDARTMGPFLVTGVVIGLILVILLKLRNIWKNQNEIKMSRVDKKDIIYFFVHLLIFVILIINSYTQVSDILNRIEETNKTVVSFTNRRVSFEGYVQDEPEKRRRFQHLNVVLLEDLHLEGKVLPKNHGQILVKTENFEKFRVGQVCKFYGTLVEPENFEDFDYINFLNNKEIYLIMEDTRYSCFDVERRRGGSVIKNKLLDLSEDLVGKIDKVLLQPRSSLLAGILFGKKRIFEPDFDSSIKVSGVSHVISASGYNITIVVLIVNRILFFLPKKVKIVLGFVSIWMFALFSGFSASIIRACIMNSLSLFALFWGRSNTVNISLPFAATIFVFLKPLILLDVGFLLSISATLGLFYILPILLAVKKKFTKRFKFTEDYLLPTMSCTLSTLPVSLITFKTFSIWAIPVNMLVLPVVEGVMLWGALSMFLFNIHKSLSYFVFTVVDLKLKYFEYIVRFIGSLNYGVWDLLNSEEIAVSLILFVILFLLVIYYYPVENEKYNHYLKDR